MNKTQILDRIEKLLFSSFVNKAKFLNIPVTEFKRAKVYYDDTLCKEGRHGWYFITEYGEKEYGGYVDIKMETLGLSEEEKKTFTDGLDDNLQKLVAGEYNNVYSSREELEKDLLTMCENDGKIEP